MTATTRNTFKSQHEIYLFFFIGMKPKDLIKLGYSTSTVYRYYRRMPEIRRRFRDALTKPAIPGTRQ